MRNDAGRPDDPRTPQRETNRLDKDEYERPRYASGPVDLDGDGHVREWHGGSEHQAPLRHEPALLSRPPRPVSGEHGQTQAEPRPQTPARGHPVDLRERPSLEEIRACDTMTRRVASVHPTTSVERAARLMGEFDCGALPVVGSDGVLVGVLTDRDIVMRIVAIGREPRSAIVADCMTERVFACYGHESLAECLRQMALRQVRRLPIVDERGRVIGIISQGDIARHAGSHAVPGARQALAQVLNAVSQPHQRR
jgi:CBS domain-containing protein